MKQALNPTENADYNIKHNLVCAYKIAALLKLDDHTYTHLSARPKDADYYYIYPFGLRFEEVSIGSLLKVNLEGEVLEGSEYQYNKTGYAIHSAIYRQRGDILAIFHIHTPHTVAVSALEVGLMPISQWALHFYDRVAYHCYNSLVLDSALQGSKLAEDLQQYYVMFLRNHGVITCGRTIHEAMFYLYHLEQACKAQILALGTNSKLVIPNANICSKSNMDLLNFEQDLGKRDWEAWVRKINRHYNE